MKVYYEYFVTAHYMAKKQFQEEFTVFFGNFFGSDLLRGSGEKNTYNHFYYYLKWTGPEGFLID